jgi:hypothetical protein
MKLKSIKSSWVGALALVVFAVTGCGGSMDYNERAKTIGVKANMKVVQEAAEKYFKDHTYMYPTVIDDDFKSYFPGGDSVAKKAGKAPLNPFNGTGEWPIIGTLTNVEEARKATPDVLAKGAIEYSPVDGGKSYGIRGGAETGKAITGESASNMGTLVLSRDDYGKSPSSSATTTPTDTLVPHVAR